MTPVTFTLESCVILGLTLCIVVCNVLTLLVYFHTELMFTYVNKYFFVSLTVSDLLFGILVLWASFGASLCDRWVFGELLCHLQAYVAVILFIVSIYSLMWMSVDYYMAIRKGDRYESVMSPMKAKCWVAFVWIAATLYCCPPLFGVSKAKYYSEAYLCVIDWHLQKAYLLTSGVLIVLPPFIALTISNCYLFTKDYRENLSYWQKVTEHNSRPEAYVRNFVIGVVYVVEWLPWCCVQIHEMIHGDGGKTREAGGGGSLSDIQPYTDSPPLLPASLHFFTTWFGIGNCAWKFVVYVVLDGDFRKGLKALYYKYMCCACCGPYHREEYV